MEIMNNSSVCDFISYKADKDILAEIFAANGIGSVCFQSGYGVRVAETEDSLIFARDGGGPSMAELIFAAWGGDKTELSAEEAAALSELGCDPDAVDRLDCRSGYEGDFSGSSKDKFAFLFHLFAKTDIAARLRYTVTKASAQGLMTPYGAFGFESRGYAFGRLNAWRLNTVGETGEDTAAVMLKNGELTVRDRGNFRWNDGTLAQLLQAADCVSAPEGMTAVKEISCADVKNIDLPVSALEVHPNAFNGCTSLEKLCVRKPNVLLCSGFVSNSVTLVGAEGGSAEKYARDNGMAFEKADIADPDCECFEIADGVWLTACATAVFRRKDNSRAALNDVYYKPAGRADDFDCEIIAFTEDEAMQSGIASQLEGFGAQLDSDTVRNDRNGYIKVTSRRAAGGEYSAAIEIDRSGSMIIMHTELPADSGAESALYRRYLEMADSVTFGSRPAADTLKQPDYGTAEQSAEAAAEPVTEVVEPAVEAVEPVAEVVEPAVETVEPAAEVVEPAVETVEPVAEVVEPAVETVEPVAEVVEAAVEAVEPIAEVVEPAVETVEPAAEVVEPAVETVEPADAPAAEEQMINAAPEDITPADESAESKSVKLIRGARFDLSAYTDKMLVVEMDYQAEEGLDIDGYIFLLGANGKVRSDADLVFFGQKSSVDRAVNNHPTNTRCFTVELGKVDKDISKLSVAFAIYGDNAAHVFSCVTKPTVRISCNGQEICSYELEGLTNEKSAVALELYNKNGWKLRTVGLGYKEALATLCGSYGVEVNS